MDRVHVGAVHLDQVPHRRQPAALHVAVGIAREALDREPDGFFETVFNKPGKTYIESSATALIASGWMQGVADGYLDEKYLELGVRALHSAFGLEEAVA